MPVVGQPISPLMCSGKYLISGDVTPLMFIPTRNGASAPSVSASDSPPIPDTASSTADVTARRMNTLVRYVCLVASVQYARIAVLWLTDWHSNNHFGDIPERRGPVTRQVADHKHRRISSLEVIESLSTPASPTQLRREPSRPGAVQSPLSFDSALATARTGLSLSPAAASGYPFTLPSRHRMNLQDGIELLECMRVFRERDGYTPAGLHIPADGPDGGEQFEVYVTHLNHPTCVKLVFWAAQLKQGKTRVTRVAQDLVIICGGFADRLLRHWGQTNGRLRDDFHVNDAGHQAEFTDQNFATEFFLDYRHEFAKFMKGTRVADVEARYVTQVLERDANLAALARLTIDSRDLAPVGEARVEASTPSGGSVVVGGLEGGPMDWMSSGQSRSGQTREVLGSGSGRDTDPIVVDDDDE